MGPDCPILVFVNDLLTIFPYNQLFTRRVVSLSISNHKNCINNASCW